MAGSTRKSLIALLALATVLFSTSLTFSGPTRLNPASYPTSTVGGVPVSISSGTGVTTVNVVTGIRIQVSPADDAWTLTITTTFGSSTQPRLNNPGNNTLIAYELEINNITGTLGAGLTLSPAANTPLVFSGNSTVITASGIASTDTDLTFDLRMTIFDASTAGKLAGNYVDTLDLLLAP